MTNYPSTTEYPKITEYPNTTEYPNITEYPNNTQLLIITASPDTFNSKFVYIVKVEPWVKGE